MRRPATLLAFVLVAAPLGAQAAQRAIATDPPRDTAHPARMEVLHIPTGGVKINSVAYLASGKGMHPTLVILHGLPGNEKNLDLAQAVRRAGWNAITFNYRGSWGSPGSFRFAHVLEDPSAVLAFLRDPVQSRRLGIDTTRLVLAGHSMGGWATAHVAARDHKLRGAILISAADMGRLGGLPRDTLVTFMADDLESLAGTTPETMADEVIAHSAEWRFDRLAEGLAHIPLLVLSSNDGLASHTDPLVAAVRARGTKRLTARHVATDHSWSDRRIALETMVLEWLAALR